MKASAMLSLSGQHQMNKLKYLKYYRRKKIALNSHQNKGCAPGGNGIFYLSFGKGINTRIQVYSRPLIMFQDSSSISSFLLEFRIIWIVSTSGRFFSPQMLEWLFFNQISPMIQESQHSLSTKDHSMFQMNYMKRSSSVGFFNQMSTAVLLLASFVSWGREFHAFS